jgi:hypothetical protein
MNNDYKNIPPFKFFVLQNFPFIEEDFDAITNYQLLCKVAEYLNKVIEQTNITGQQVEELTHYFDNLDVQEEINNKLDEMAESGQLTEIIAQYLQLQGLLCYNTKSDLKNADNIANGSFVKTYGTLTYNDGEGEFYKIRELTNQDVVDDDNIVALFNFPLLIAEKIPDKTINDILTDINNLKNNSISNRHVVFIGDSYLTGSTAGQQFATDGWAKRIIDFYSLTNSYAFGEGGAGFTVTGHDGHNFNGILSSNLENVSNKNIITDIICCGGYNDKNSTYDTIKNAIATFVNTCKTNFPNAKVYIGCTAWNKEINTTGQGIRNNILNIVYRAYHDSVEKGALYLNGVENSLKVNEYISTDNFHPTPDGYQKLCHDIVQAWLTGKVYLNTTNLLAGISLSDIITDGDVDYSNSGLFVIEQINNDILYLSFSGLLQFNNDKVFDLNTPIKLGHLNFKATKKVATDNFYFNQDLKIGTSFMPTSSVWYIDVNNDLYVIFYELPSGITQGNKINFSRIENYIPVALI